MATYYSVIVFSWTRCIYIAEKHIKLATTIQSLTILVYLCIRLAVIAS